MIAQLFDEAVDPDRALMRVMGSMIDAAAVRHALDLSKSRFEPGRPLKLLFAGYCGTRNTGSDVRVEEMVRQLRAILGDDAEFSVLTIDPERSGGYFRGARQLLLPTFFPKFLFDQCGEHHGVVACEGSMFKSKFANALSVMMAGALGLAAAEGKLGVGYGAEAGTMEPSLRDFVRGRCKHALVICRNEPSRRTLEGMGIRALGGTDTAWTFEPAPPARGAELLRAAGWDGVRPVLVLCPINPFWWPTRPDLLKAVAHELGGQFGFEHYKSFYFHEWSEAAAARYEAYLDGMAEAANAFAQEHRPFTVVVGTEMLDRGACEQLSARLSTPAPVLVSDELDMYELVSILRQASLLVSSRFHAIVTSMPGGVPSVGVTMDERIQNLMEDRGHLHLLLRVEQPHLGERLLHAMRRAHREAERVRRDVLAFVPGQIRRMAEMGMDFADELRRVYPEFPLNAEPRSMERHLPPLSPALQRLMSEHA